MLVWSIIYVCHVYIHMDMWIYLCVIGSKLLLYYMCDITNDCGIAHTCIYITGQ